MTSHTWLHDAVFYQLYPQSFNDTNHDGIGDLPGITAKLPYLAELGINAIWINPIFDSPFLDAGYDIRDYYTIAPRYGALSDLHTLVDAAHNLNIKILLDLVPGHTSDQHPWFQNSRTTTQTPDDDRYIWTNSWFGNASGLPFVAGVAPRNGCYVLNFFHSQPALNFGFANPTEPWQDSLQGVGPAKNRDEIANILRFWLSQGVDGFRVDMADSLVKFDTPEKTATIETWREIFSSVKPEFPDAVFVSEWGHPWQSFAAGFDMDFYLDWPGNGYNKLIRSPQGVFHADSDTPVAEFFDDYLPQYHRTRDDGLFCFISGSHDNDRLAYHLTDRERRLYFLFMLTMPGAPFLYYGDEIGMTWHDLPTHEGGYTRTGSRTPMQWDASLPNCGFTTSTSPYLPAFSDTDVVSQRNCADSLLNYVKSLIALRHQTPDLQGVAALEVISHPEHPRLMHYRRGDCEIYLNLSQHELTLSSGGKSALFSFEASVAENITLPSFSGVILH
ncbi:alpha-amylase family glycosyl hydrolase [Corynebacterium sp. HS2168-gen11]|nr:alpha-amylase family glycosyl hydrolase [Corynebacterium sp. HS2168-gen11]